MTKVGRRILTLLGVLIACVGVGSMAFADVVPDGASTVPVYTYDIPRCDESTCYTAPECGPPAFTDVSDC